MKIDVNTIVQLMIMSIFFIGFFGYISFVVTQYKKKTYSIAINTNNNLINEYLSYRRKLYIGNYLSFEKYDVWRFFEKTKKFIF